MRYNSSIIPKKKQLICGCYDYPFSKNMCKMHASQKSTQKRIDKHEGEQEDESFKNLVEDLDDIFSKWIRLKYADENGVVKCYTCPTKKPYTEMQNGHWIPRSSLGTRWLPENCRPQCPKCNVLNYGESAEFEALLKKEGNHLPEWVKEQGRVVEKPTRYDLKGLINGYRFKVKILLSKLKK